MDVAEGRLARHQYQRPSLLEHHRTGARQQVVIDSCCQFTKRVHRAGDNDHRPRAERAGGNRSGDIGIAVHYIGQGFNFSPVAIALVLVHQSRRVGRDEVGLDRLLLKRLEQPYTVRDAGGAAHTNHNAVHAGRETLAGLRLQAGIPPPAVNPVTAAAPMEFTAPGKVILFGEHAVVYGYPAIAVPLSGLRARAWTEPTRDGAGLVIHARDLGQRLTLGGDPGHQFSVAAQAVLARTGAPEPNATVNLESAIPSAAGMGSSAATSTAVCRALAAHLGAEMSATDVSNIVFQAERVVHGTPSGIDNTVIAHEEPVWFTSGEPPRPFRSPDRCFLVLGDTGITASTGELVAGVRERRDAEPRLYDGYFAEIGARVSDAREALKTGELERVGKLMDANHKLLNNIGVGHPKLDELVAIARDAGALGAKLTGKGGGGNIVALAAGVDSQTAVTQALTEAGYTAYETAFGGAT